MTRILFLPALALFLFFAAGCSNDDPLKQFYTSVHLNEGNYFYNGGNYDRAIERYSRAIRLDPEGEFSFGSYYFRAFSYYNKGSYGAAIKDFTTVIALSPKFEDAYIARGNCYALKKLYSEAISDFQDVIRMNTNNAYAYFNLGNAYGSMGLPDLAIRNYSRSIAVSLEFFGTAYLRRGETYNTTGSFDQAITDLTRVIDNDPNSRDAYAARRFSYEKKGWSALAKKDAAKVRELGLVLAKDFLDAANLMLANGEPDRAIDYYTRSLELDPSGKDRAGNAGEVYIYRGQIYFYSERYDEAIGDFLSALKINPENWLALSDLGTCYAKRGEYARAEKLYLESVRLNPSNDLAVFNLGKLYSDRHEPAKAIYYFSRFLRMNPEHPMAYALRAEQYYQSKNYTNTVSDCTRALELGLKNDILFLLRANAESELGRKIPAIEDYGRYIASAKDPSAGYVGRAEAYLQLKDYRKAADDYRRSLDKLGSASDNADTLSFISNQIRFCEQKLRD